MIAISLLENKGKDAPKAVVFDEGLFHTGAVFNALSIVIVGLLAVIYLAFW